MQPSPSTPPSGQPSSNRLLAALPATDLARWSDQLSPINWQAGELVCDSRQASPFAYFPADALVLLVYGDEASGTLGMAVVGHDGVVDLPRLLGANAPFKAVALTAGSGHRLDQALWSSALDQGGTALKALLRYSQSLVTQMTQTALCHAQHSPAQQLSRWLLVCAALMDGPAPRLPTRSLQSALGLPPQQASEALEALAAEGSIACEADVVAVRDTQRLQSLACGCASAILQQR